MWGRLFATTFIAGLILALFLQAFALLQVVEYLPIWFYVGVFLALFWLAWGWPRKRMQ